MQNKYTIAIDFDGTIHDHSKHKWTTESDIPGELIPGTKEAIDKLSEKYNIVVISTRCNIPDGKYAIQKWLEKHKINVFDVSSERPPALFTIDDRAIQFTGDWNIMLKDIENFKVWYK